MLFCFQQPIKICVFFINLYFATLFMVLRFLHKVNYFFHFFSSLYRVTHKKMIITKNRIYITSKILFILTQNFSYIRSSLCSRHLQSFKFVLQKLFVSLALKKCAPNELSSAAGTFGSGRKSSLTLPHSSLGITLIAAVIGAFRSGIV